MTQDELKKLIHYSPETGLFTKIFEIDEPWVRKDVHSIQNGYIRIKHRGINLFGHQAAFLYMTGSIPSLIDHRDLNRENNAWLNLRDSTHAQNMQNKCMHKNNNTGVKGVRLTIRGTYRACIISKGKPHSKTFDNLDEATKWVRAKREELHGEFTNHG